MFTERLVQIKEKFSRPQPIDLAQKLLDEKFQSLELTDQEIGVFGVEFLRNQMGVEPIRNLKVARSLAVEKALEFKTEVVGVLNDSESSNLFKEKLQGVLAYGALEITRQVLRDPDLSYRRKKRQLVFLETFLSKNGIPSEHSKFLVREGKKEAKKAEIVRNLVTGAKVIFGIALGSLGIDFAEKYIPLLPAAQEALGLAIIIGTSASRAATKILAEANPNWKKMDKALATVQPVITGIGIGVVGHGLFDQFSRHGEVLAESIKEQVGKLPKPQIPQPAVQIHPIVPETPAVPTQIVETAKYTVTGFENGGVTDVVAHFHQDPYGEAMTKFILQNKDVLTDGVRKGHDAAVKLEQFLQSNPNYTWRDAMNESAKAGHATDVSKMFTEALKYIRPGTTFAVSV